MRKLSILASLLLVLALTASYAVAAPSSVGDDPVVVADEDKDDGKGDNGDNDNGEEAKKSSKSRSYRDKLDSRGQPKAKTKGVLIEGGLV